MSSPLNVDNKLKSVRPLQMMGVFWLILGIVVLFGSFFIKGTPYISQTRGVVTNVIAGSILFIIGLLSFLCGRSANKGRTL